MEDQAVTESTWGKAVLCGRMVGTECRLMLHFLFCPSFCQVGSRLSVQISAVACMVLGMSPRLAELLTRIPLAVHGGYPALALHCSACRLPGAT